MPADKKGRPNRLIYEQSPYLLQHAYNPVNWFPWGKEAFEKAKDEDKPIFLSIGYSTCHWCHVMERETFEDPFLAQTLNNGFVSIKVDREERPDIDHIYMDVCQAMTGKGGWPLSVFMDARGRPFFTGTYFSRGQFADLLQKLRDLWEQDREKLLAASSSVQQFLDARDGGSGEIKAALPGEVYAALVSGFDEAYGGFTDAPKFPSPHILLFLMRYTDLRGEPRALEMAVETLDAIERGGIHDHIGYGFCRYSTDRRWLAPHFEKMLYDNALLAYTYAQAFRKTGEERFGKTARTTLAYLKRVLCSPEGGFYTAEDADSQGVEGKFYLWTRAEVNELLGDGAEAFCTQYDITETGNFEGKNIINLIGKTDTTDMETERKILFAAREKRVHPFLDDKILCCWNGLCMAAFAFAGRILGEGEMIETAKGIWAFIRSKMMDKSGALLSSWRGEGGAHPGHADDYSYVIWGLLELFEATDDPECLSEAVRLSGVLADEFEDEASGALFFTGRNAEKLITRTKTGYDGAVPSANSVHAENLFWLYALTGDLMFAGKGEKMIAAFAGEAARSPSAFAFMMRALLRREREEARVVVAGRSGGMAGMLACAKAAGALTVRVDADSVLPDNLKDYYEAYIPKDKKSAAYVCRGHKCLPPVNGVEALKKLL